MIQKLTCFRSGTGPRFESLEELDALEKEKEKEKDKTETRQEAALETQNQEKDLTKEIDVADLKKAMKYGYPPAWSS